MKNGRKWIKAFVDSLEPRTMFCAEAHAAGVVNSVMGPTSGLLAGLPVGVDGHVARADFLKTHGEYAGKDLWDPAVFNPKNSSDSSKWLYDPHLIADDAPTPAGPKSFYTTGLTRSATTSAIAGPVLLAASVQDVLPDFYPTLNGTPYMDRTQQAGRALLRFGTQVNNAGLGPGTLVGGPANSDGTQTVYQRIYQWNSSTNALTTSYERVAGRFTYHPTHSHLHFDGYAKYRLMNLDGTPVIRPDGSAAQSAKIGFCLINVNSSFTLPSGQSSTTLATYRATGMPSTGCGQLQGVNPGRADVYQAALADQWIDVTGVPDGNYKVEITLDAQNGMLESDENNNVAQFSIAVTGNGAGAIVSDRFEPNESIAAAANLGQEATATVSGLTLHAAGNQDYFKFTAASTATSTVSSVFTDGDLDLYLYNSTGTLLKSSTATGTGSSTTPASESVSYAFTEGTTYIVRVAAKSTSGTSRAYELRFAIPPKVTLATPDASATEGTDGGAVTIVRNGQVGTPLTVNFTVSGTAVRGVDYQLMTNNAVITGNSITLGVEPLNQNIDIVPLTDTFTESTETVTITLASSTSYVIGSPNAGTVSIIDQPATTPLVPTAPSGLSATWNPALPGVVLNWTDNSSNEASFVLQRRYAGWLWESLATANANTSTYTDLSVIGGVTYEYRVLARNSAGDSTWQEGAMVLTSGSGGGTTDPLLPTAPTGLRGTWSTANRNVTLTWNDNATNEANYIIQRRYAGWIWEDLATIAVNSTSYTDTTAVSTVTYEYRVLARNAVGDSAWNDGVFVATV